MNHQPPSPTLSPSTTLFRSSLGEGFGLTAAESAACGTPVIASDDPALAELLGEAGMYADPRRPERFAELFRAAGIRSEEHTSELQSRRDLVCRLLLEKKKLA